MSVREVNLTNPFALLDLDLHLQVFSKLSIDKGMAEASRVCKLWKTTMENPTLARLQFEQIKQKQTIVFKQWKQWHDSAIKRFKLDHDLIENLKQCPCIETLDLSNSHVDDALIKRIGSLNLPSLKKLLLKNCYRIVDPDFRGFSNLLTLDLSNCKKLKQPNFSGLSKLSSIHLQKWNIKFSLKELPSLKFLDLSENSFRDRELKTIVEGLSQLETLVLNTCKGLYEPDLTSLISLKRLELVYCLELISCNLKNLTFLQRLLLSATKVNDDFVNSLSQQNLSSLEHLDLSICHQIVRPIFNLNQLKTLNLKCCPNVNTVDLRGSPSFETLSIEHNAHEITPLFPAEYLMKTRSIANLV